MKQTIYVLINAIIILLIISSCTKSQAKQTEETGSIYDVISVTKKTVTAYQAFPTSIEGKINNSVRAKISGYIQELYVDEGQFVKKGQALFRLETNTLSESANAAKSSIASAESNVNLAQMEVSKLIPLVEKNIVSKIQLETAKANLARAKSQLASSEANYQSITANINYSIIRSPISGVVGALPFKAGSLVGPADPTPLTFISDNSEVYAYFSMNEKEYFNFLKNSEGETVKEKLNHLPRVRLRLANNELYEEQGKIESITGQFDPTTGTIRFRVLFANKNGFLSNGNSGTILIPKKYKDVLVVPESSTFEEQGIVYVYVVENDTAKSTVIKVAERIDRMAIVESGLKENDKVVALGVGTLRNGTAVRPREVQFDSIVNSIKSRF